MPERTRNHVSPSELMSQILYKFLEMTSPASTYLEDFEFQTSATGHISGDLLRERWSNFRLINCPSIATSFTATVDHIFPTTNMTLKAKGERLDCFGDGARLAFDRMDSNV